MSEWGSVPKTHFTVNVSTGYLFSVHLQKSWRKSSLTPKYPALPIHGVHFRPLWNIVFSMSTWQTRQQWLLFPHFVGENIPQKAKPWPLPFASHASFPSSQSRGRSWQGWGWLLLPRALLFPSARVRLLSGQASSFASQCLAQLAIDLVSLDRYHVAAEPLLWFNLS